MQKRNWQKGSIRSNPKNPAKKRARHDSNMSIRAALYSEWQRKTGNNCGEWHTTLNALSQGTAG